MSQITEQLEHLRREYQRAELHTVAEDPFAQCQLWLEQAISAQLPDPTAMVLATANKEAEPSIRVVLLKGIEDKQFIFYSNYDSPKGQDIAQNPKVAVDFFWPLLERQIIIKGQIKRLSAAASDAYFGQRPRESQLATYASHQSQVIDSREFLIKQQQVMAAQFENKPIPRPENWGGYAISPYYFEFWQGRENRLHDRIVYTLTETNWHIKRLSP